MNLFIAAKEHGFDEFVSDLCGDKFANLCFHVTKVLKFYFLFFLETNLVKKKMNELEYKVIGL